MEREPTPRTVAVVLSLLALIPIGVYAAAQGVAGAYMAISVVSVLLVAGSLYLMFGPGEAESGGDHAGS